jgi:hypothetical protein
LGTTPSGYGKRIVHATIVYSLIPTQQNTAQPVVYLSLHSKTSLIVEVHLLFPLPVQISISFDPILYLPFYLRRPHSLVYCYHR